MMRGMFSAISGLRNHQVALDVTANDIANVNTIGYKSARVTFKDSLSQLQRGAAAPGGAGGGTNAAQVGLGSNLGSIDNLMAGGALQNTGNPLDVAIQGDAFFRIGQSVAPASPANFEYTRAGNFATNSAGYLTTQDGYYVVGRTEPGPAGTDTLINIPQGASAISIAQDGAVSFVPPNGGARQVGGYVSLAKFSNASGLERAAGNRWRESANSGQPAVDAPSAQFGSLTQSGTIEMSNVDLAGAFTSMITAQRGFQANSRVISVSDEMLQDLVNLKR